MAQEQSNRLTLTNKDITAMVRAKISDDVIIEKIRTSRCNFDTFPSVLSELKYHGVSDSVLMAMIQAPVGALIKRSASADLPSASRDEIVGDAVEIIVPADTAVDVETAYSVSSEDVQEGSKIGLIVVNPVKVGGVVVIERNARATAMVTKATAGRRWARGGQLAWEIQDVMALDGTRIPVQFTKGSKTGGGKSGSMAAGMIVTGIFFLPAVPLWGLKKGKPAVLPGGKQFQVYTRTETSVKVKN